MVSSGNYLLKKICEYEKNGLESLGKLNGAHFEDLTKVIKSYAVETVLEVVESLNNGETVDMDGHILSLKKRKK